LDKEFPAVKQKPLISNSQRSDTNMKQTAKSASFVLPSKVAAKIYTNLHKNSQVSIICSCLFSFTNQITAIAEIKVKLSKILLHKNFA